MHRFNIAPSGQIPGKKESPAGEPDRAQRDG